MLDTLSDFKDLFFVSHASNSMMDSLRISIKSNFSGEMYCPRCGGYRRMSVELLYPVLRNGVVEQLILSDANLNGTKHNKPKIDEYIHKLSPLLSPSLWQYTCLQCDTTFTTVIYEGPNEQAMAILPSCNGGISTPNTPQSVKYYLDQASKAKSIGASSASIAMFRAALDSLLFQQGYQKGMLGSKIQQLCSDIDSGSAPKWAMELEVDFLKVIKDLGNGSIHPNEGDINTQAQLDNELVSRVLDTFLLLLFLIYEVEIEKTNRLNSLKLKANLIKK